MRASCFVLVVVAGAAQAQEGLAYGFGTGRQGFVSASTASIFNLCTGVRSLNGTQVELDSAVGFAAQDLLLFHHTQAAADAGLVDLSRSTVGRYFFRRITSVSGNRVTLDRPVEFLTEGVVQAVLVIEARVLSVRYTESIDAPPWNGRCGGILAALVSERFDTDGTLWAQGRGFRGGGAVPQPAAMLGCAGDLVATVGPGFAPTGEGLVAGAWGVTAGAVALSSGGAGGVCRAAGGGGGANTGRGGVGGASADGIRPVGGAAGTATPFAPLERAFFGGGGGAGHRDGVTTRGGNGGGFIFVRARTVDSRTNARVIVNGSDGEDAREEGGGGGGGGGGTLVLQAFEVTSNDGVLRAAGGSGGWVRLTTGSAGPGGGGGGGAISTWTPRSWNSDSVGGPTPVFRRLFPDGGEESQGSRGATGGSNGRNDANQRPFVGPDAGSDAGTSSLSVTAPLEAEVVRSRRPRLAGSGEPGRPVALRLDGQPLATLAPALDGQFEASPLVDLADGPHEVVVEQGAFTVQRRFVTDVTAPVAPAIASPRPRAIFSESPGVVRGAAEANARVRIFFDDAPEVGETVVEADGGFTFLVPSPLADGDHTVSAVAEDAAGNVSERSDAVPFRVSSRLERPMDAAVRHGCSAGPGLSLLVAVAAWFARRRRR